MHTWNKESHAYSSWCQESTGNWKCDHEGHIVSLYRKPHIPDHCTMTAQRGTMCWHCPRSDNIAARIPELVKSML